MKHTHVPWSRLGKLKLGSTKSRLQRLTVSSAFVVVADLDEELGSKLEKELSGYVNMTISNIPVTVKLMR